MNEADAVAVVLFVGRRSPTRSSAGPTSAPASGISSPGGAERGDRPAQADRPLDRPGVGGEPRLADLLPRRAVDRVLGGVRVDHAHAVRAAHARGARHRAARLELRVPQGGLRHVGPAQLRRDLRRRRRCSSRTAWVRWPARSRPDGCRRVARRAIRGTAGSTRRRSSAACSRSRSSRTSPRSTWSGTRGGLGDDALVEYFRRRAVVAVGRRRASSRSWGSSCCTTTRATSSTASRRARLPLVIVSGAVRDRIARAARARRRPRRAAARDRRGRDRRRRLGRRAVAVHPARDARRSSQAAAPSGTLTAVLVVFAFAVRHHPAVAGLLYVLDQKSLLPGEGVDSPPLPPV